MKRRWRSFALYTLAFAVGSAGYAVFGQHIYLWTVVCMQFALLMSDLFLSRAQARTIQKQRETIDMLIETLHEKLPLLQQQVQAERAALAERWNQALKQVN